MRDRSDIHGFHAHIYYDEQIRDSAAALREAIELRFEVRMGRWREDPVGPHPQSMYQVAFTPDVFAEIVPWLMLNHGPHSVFIHPETDDELKDHSLHEMWLGKKLVLNLSMFS